MDKYLYANIMFSKFSRDYTALKKDFPIRPSEMGVLNIIIKREGFFTPVMIAELLGVSKPMVTTHITVLEEKGYIVKKACENDKRSFYVLPTDKARILVEEAEKKINIYLEKIENHIGTENFELLVDLMADVNTILREENLKENI